MAASDGGAGVLSRTSLLALYTSPLVPNKLEGMKELSEWYGEYTTPPSPPIQRSQLSSSRANSSSAVPQSTSSSSGNHRRLTPFNSDSNPFANFGRFGVDGGLIGEPLEMPRRRGGKAGVDGDAASPASGKDLAPHLQMGSGGRKMGGLRDDVVPPWASDSSKRGNFLKDERNARANRTGEPANGEAEPRRRGGANGDTPNGKDRRGMGPADEGGWRSVGTTREEREKRLLRNQNSSNSNPSTDSPRRFERDRRDNDRGDRGDRETYARGGRGGPAWMNDEDPSSASSWMDSAGGGHAKLRERDGAAGTKSAGGERDDDEILDAATPTKKNADWQAASGSGGMDSIQQWKMQMKEMERKERERDLRDAGIEPESRQDSREGEPESVFSALTSPKAEPASTASKSIFEDLGIVRSPAVTPAAPPGLSVASGQSSSSGEPGGRASRFAKFFDGKPQSPVTQAQQPPASVFGALMGGVSTTAAGPSKEDADSMARLLGMLQVQGSRTGSPSTNQPPVAEPIPSGLASPAAMSSPAPPSATAPISSAGEESRSSSRFKFSNSSARTSSPSVGTRSVPPSQPPSAMHSPTSTNQTIPPPPPPPGFAGYKPPQAHPGMNHLASPSLSASDRMRSPPLPVPQSQQQQHQYQSGHNHPRTISATSDLSSRPPQNHQPAPSASPLPVPTHAMNHSQQHHAGQPPSFPPQFFNQVNGHQRMAQGGPLSPSHGINLPPMGMFPPPPPPPGPNGQMPQIASPPPPPMMNPDMLRTLAATNGMRSPPLAGLPQGGYLGGPVPPPPPHGVAQGGVGGPGMHARGGPPPPLAQQQGQQMMFAPAPPLQHQQYPGGARLGGGGAPPMSMGGNAGADLMALLNSGGNGGMRIGGQGPPRQQQGNLPPFLMEGR